MKLPATLHRKIIDFLQSLPTIHNADSRRAFIYHASLDSQLQDQIFFDKPAAQFVLLLVTELMNYGALQDGRNALEAILETAKYYVGQEKKEHCDRLIKEVHIFYSNHPLPDYQAKKVIEPIPESQVTFSVFFLIIGLILFFECLNALSKIQGWQTKKVPSIIDLATIGNNWEANVYAIIIIIPIYLLILLLGGYYASERQKEYWPIRIPDLPKLSLNNELVLGKIFKLCIILTFIFFPLLCELFISNKFFYGTVYKNDVSFSCGYFNPEICHPDYDPTQHAQQGHLQYVPLSEIQSKSNTFRYGKKTGYIPFWEAWSIIIANIVVVSGFIIYIYFVFRGCKSKTVSSLNKHV